MFSCEKDRSIECYTCRWETKMLNFNAYYSTIIDTCMSERDMIRYEETNTWTTDKQKNRVTCWQQGEPPLPNPGF